MIELIKAEIYSRGELDDYFKFPSDHYGGIRVSTIHDAIVLFSFKHAPYDDRDSDKIFYYVGQDTGPGDQQLKYRNEDLNHALLNGRKIYLFTDWKSEWTDHQNEKRCRYEGQYELARGETFYEYEDVRAELKQGSAYFEYKNKNRWELIFPLKEKIG